MYDFIVPDEDSSDYSGAISVVRGTNVSVFGNPNDVSLPETLSNADILKFIDCVDGWCQVQTESGIFFNNIPNKF